MSESLVFELKLQIQHLQEKLTFMAGGSDGAELVDVLMEKDEELERNTRKLKEVETRMFQLGEGAKRVDAKRRDLARQCEHQAVRIGAMETELGRRVELTEELRRKVADTRDELVANQADLRKTREEMAASEEAARQTLEEARAESSELQRMVESQRQRITELEAEKKSLEKDVVVKDKAVKSMEDRKKDVAAKARDMKARLESMLTAAQDSLLMVTGERDQLEKAVLRFDKQLAEKKEQLRENEEKCTGLTRESNARKKALELAENQIASGENDLAAVCASKEKADKTLRAKDEENAEMKREIEKLSQEISTLKQQANQDKSTLEEKLDHDRHTHEELQATLQDQMQRQENDNNMMLEVLMAEKTGVEEKLKMSKSECLKLAEEGSALRKEAAVRAKKAEAHSKNEGRWRARAEETLAAVNAENQELKSELDRLRHQGVELNKLQGENTELKDRIERQEAYHKRKMEKEKKDRARASSRSSSVGPSGRASLQLLPLPPAMGDPSTSNDPIEISNRVPAPTTAYSNRRASLSSAIGVGTRSTSRPPTPLSAGGVTGLRGSHGGITTTDNSKADGPTLSPYQAPRSPDTSPSPRNAPASTVRTSTDGGDGEGTRAMFSTPSAPVAVKKPSSATARSNARPFPPTKADEVIPPPAPQVPFNETSALTNADEASGRRSISTRATASRGEHRASSGGGGADGGGDEVEEQVVPRKVFDRESDVDCGNGGDKLAKSGGRGSSGLGLVINGNRRMTLSSGRVGGTTNEKGMSGGRSGSGGGGVPRTRGRTLETRTIRSVSKATALGLNDENATTRYPSRGRRAVAAKVSTPRSSSEGLQSRAARGWR